MLSLSGFETGPHKHAIQQTFFLYIWEPCGNRIDLDAAVEPDLLGWSPSEDVLVEVRVGQHIGGQDTDRLVYARRVYPRLAVRLIS